MKIHHFTFPAREPERVARVVGELTGGRVMPMPHPHGAWMIVDEEEPTTLLEVWPLGSRVPPGQARVADTGALFPDGWPHHAYVSVDREKEEILAILDREGWTYDVAWNGAPGGAGFELVRVWVENQAVIELATAEQLAQYDGLVRAMVARARDQAAS